MPVWRTLEAMSIRWLMTCSEPEAGELSSASPIERPLSVSTFARSPRTLLSPAASFSEFSSSSSHWVRIISDGAVWKFFPTPRTFPRYQSTGAVQVAIRSP